jgi:hypothetical protein
VHLQLFVPTLQTPLSSGRLAPPSPPPLVLPPPIPHLVSTYCDIVFHQPARDKCASCETGRRHLMTLAAARRGSSRAFPRTHTHTSKRLACANVLLDADEWCGGGFFCCRRRLDGMDLKFEFARAPVLATRPEERTAVIMSPG